MDNRETLLSISIVRETSSSSFRYTWPWIGTTRCLRLNKSCWPKILYRKNYGDKNGSKTFQQQRKMFCRKFGWPSMKVLQIKVGGLKLFGRSLKGVHLTEVSVKRELTSSGFSLRILVTVERCNIYRKIFWKRFLIWIKNSHRLPNISWRSFLCKWRILWSSMPNEHPASYQTNQSEMQWVYL